MYVALYRKLRSLSFADMVGQEHITKTLKNQILTDRVSHAYLFCGIRGTGKTTVARILSRALNCTNLSDGEPCNKCEACTEILNERSMDVREINAASQNGVDDVRTLIDEAAFSPISCKYKVYIIDEVHMFSQGAFNALLKTLEEPPAHVVFLLATTEAHKIPTTILSRCQRFDLRRISVKDTAQHLKKQTKELNICITDDAIMYIASVADGSMRDALNLLEQCQAFFFDCEITEGRVQNLLGAADSSVFFALTEALYAQNPLMCMRIIDEAMLTGRETGRFVTDIIKHLRNILIAAVTGADAPINASAEQIQKMAEQGKKFDTDVLSRYIYAFAELQSRLRFISGADERTLLEVTCIRLLNPQTENTNEAVISRIAALETKTASLAGNLPFTLEEPETPPKLEFAGINFEIEED